MPNQRGIGEAMGNQWLDCAIQWKLHGLTGVTHTGKIRVFLPRLCWGTPCNKPIFQTTQPANQPNEHPSNEPKLLRTNQTMNQPSSQPTNKPTRRNQGPRHRKRSRTNQKPTKDKTNMYTQFPMYQPIPFPIFF